MVLGLPLSSQAENLRPATLCVSYLALSRLGVQLLVALQSPQAGQLHIAKVFFSGSITERGSRCNVEVGVR